MKREGTLPISFYETSITVIFQTCERHNNLRKLQTKIINDHRYIKILNKTLVCQIEAIIKKIIRHDNNNFISEVQM